MEAGKRVARIPGDAVDIRPMQSDVPAMPKAKDSGARPPKAARRHHYVPQWLLKQFAFERKPGKFQTHIFDKRTNRKFLTSVESAMVEQDFNAVEISGERISFEGTMGKIEGAAAPIVAKIRSSESIFGLSEGDRRALARFVALQKIRGTNIRAQLRQLGDEFARMGLDVPASDGEAEKLLALNLVHEGLPEFSEAVADKDILLFRACAETEFILGDSGVAFHNDEKTDPYGNLGFHVLGIQIYLPISPSLALGFWCPTLMHKFQTGVQNARRLKAMSVLGRSDLRELALQQQAVTERVLKNIAPIVDAYSKGIPIETLEDNVTFMNSLQIREAERYVSSRKGTFELALRMISDNERYRHGLRLKF